MKVGPYDHVLIALLCKDGVFLVGLANAIRANSLVDGLRTGAPRCSLSPLGKGGLADLFLAYRRLALAVVVPLCLTLFCGRDAMASVVQPSFRLLCNHFTTAR